MENLYNKKPLPDILATELKVLFIGYNPGILSAQRQHHYSHKSNRFWRLLFESGMTPYRFDPEDDHKLLELGYGSTNIVDRPSKAANEVGADEIDRGSVWLYGLINEIKPRVACYVGIGVYRAYAASILKASPSGLDVKTGLQQSRIHDDTLDFVCSSTSGLNTIPFDEQRRCFEDLKRLLGQIGKN